MTVSIENIRKELDKLSNRKYNKNIEKDYTDFVAEGQSYIDFGNPGCPRCGGRLHRLTADEFYCEECGRVC